jgi:hypothetical protein
MERSEIFDSLEFQDDLDTHDDIREMAGVDLDIVVAGWRADLLAEWDAGPGNFVTKAP